jgi:hypothetical protein
MYAGWPLSTYVDRRIWRFFVNIAQGLLWRARHFPRIDDKCSLLPGIKPPMLVLTEPHDPFVPPRNGESLARQECFLQSGPQR